MSEVRASNYEFDITDNGRLEDWIRCCVGDNSARYWEVRRTNGKPTELVFKWASDEDSGEFPMDMDAELIAAIAGKWLRNSADYGEGSDMDGHANPDGFRLRSDSFYDVLLVSPVWSEYHK